jgi:two-component system, NtrC family, sensor kinase
MTTRRPKTPKRKRRKTTGEAASRRSAADLQKQLDRRTRELAKTRKLLKEALQQQSATSEVLQVINSSAVELASVFDAMLKRAMRLCEAAFGGLWVFEGDRYVAQALCGVPPAYASYLRNMNLVPGPHTAPYRFLQGERSAIQNVDLAAEEPYLTGDPQRRALVDLGGARAALQVPLVRDELVLGVITVYRQEVRPFSEQQVTLLQNFADQAVIAIENVRLFKEVQVKTDDLSEALRYQTGSANILNVIASSPTDVAPVLKAIVVSACELCDAYDAVVILKDGEELQLSAHHGPIPMNRQRWANNRTSVSGRAMADRRPVHVHDVLADEGLEFEMARGMSLVDGCRTLLSAPLLREGEPIGAVALRRSEVHPFSEKQISLLQTFADQAVIAIGNVRLFAEVQERTRELSKSLEDLRTAQDRLIQTEKLASLGQLTAGIAHEIKNPLNFVNNFSALSAELVGEMKDALSDIDLDKNKREELDEIAQMLKDNLEKVVQHGKRADSIVKNMLLHSREGSGEHRPADINAIVDESLNLAYHGARAEKAGFSIALQRDLDPSVGMADFYPQEITRALLNLISNGFYATAKRKVEAGDGFEPMLSATTKNLGDKIEICIRDNGTGIPEEVKAKIFNPFFTTKPSGEGTGLGLSMSHDIIVKQHGGSIDVETEPGLFTEFKIILPRT